MGDEHERRVGLNEAVFREVNERLKALNSAFTTVTETMDLICECADTTCTSHIAMSPQEYEALRAEATHFAVAPGHAADEDSERVVDRRRGYDVVEKLDDAAEIAEQTDPRNE
jgi:hypothetical protein